MRAGGKSLSRYFLCCPIVPHKPDSNGSGCQRHGCATNWGNIPEPSIYAAEACPTGTRPAAATARCHVHLEYDRNLARLVQAFWFKRAIGKTSASAEPAVRVTTVTTLFPLIDQSDVGQIPARNHPRRRALGPQILVSHMWHRSANVWLGSVSIHWPVAMFDRVRFPRRALAPVS